MDEAFVKSHLVIVDSSYRLDEEVEYSRSYPGLKTVYNIHTVKCRVKDVENPEMSFIGLPEGNDFAVTRVSLKPSSSGATTACCQQRSLDAGFQTEDKVCDPRRLAEKASCRRYGFGSLGMPCFLSAVRNQLTETGAARKRVQCLFVFPLKLLERKSFTDQHKDLDMEVGCSACGEAPTGAASALKVAALCLLSAGPQTGPERGELPKGLLHKHAGQVMVLWLFMCGNLQSGFYEDCLASFPELLLYTADDGGLVSSGRSALEEFQRTMGALFAVFWFMRRKMGGAESFCFGVDDEWEPLNARSKQPRRKKEEIAKRQSFFNEVEWERIDELLHDAGLLCDGVEGHDEERVLAMLVLTAIHDIMKLVPLLPSVAPEHAPYRGYKAGETIHDHDIALSYVLDHYSYALPSYHELSKKQKDSIRFTQCKMEYNMGWLVQARLLTAQESVSVLHLLSMVRALTSDPLAHSEHLCDNLFSHSRAMLVPSHPSPNLLPLPDAGSLAPGGVVGQLLDEQPPLPPPSLLEGFPDPQRVDARKKEYLNALQEQVRQRVATLTQRHQANLEYLRAKNDQCKKQAQATIDQELLKQEMEVDRRHDEQLLALQQAAMRRKFNISKEAGELTLQYQTKATQEKLQLLDFELHRRYFDAAAKPLEWTQTQEARNESAAYCTGKNGALPALVRDCRCSIDCDGHASPSRALFVILVGVRCMEDGGVEPADVAFYFCHWLTDLAGAEPYPQEGCEKFVLKFPRTVLSSFIKSFKIVGELAVKCLEVDLPSALAWGSARKETARLSSVGAPDGALTTVPAQDRDVLEEELAHTGCKDQLFELENLPEGAVPMGPAILIYYAPALMQKAELGWGQLRGPRVGKEQLSAAFALRDFGYWQRSSDKPGNFGRQGMLPSSAGLVVTVRIDVLKELEVKLITAATPGEVWALEKTSSRDAEVKKVSLGSEALSQGFLAGNKVRMLNFTKTPHMSSLGKGIQTTWRKKESKSQTLDDFAIDATRSASLMVRSQWRSDSMEVANTTALDGARRWTLEVGRSTTYTVLE
ncbi:unnamed protein product [Symbiodinium pilosum]|uniref:Uncharacterized protein n=1 Tax=Symbiodinium pilosum TaxID=2952 RepID=A0A812LJK8_SYMPI|nr:unnamed protein product [Symbiodinium pilosum]